MREVVGHVIQRIEAGEEAGGGFGRRGGCGSGSRSIRRDIGTRARGGGRWRGSSWNSRRFLVHWTARLENVLALRLLMECDGDKGIQEVRHCLEE